MSCKIFLLLHRYRFMNQMLLFIVMISCGNAITQEKEKDISFIDLSAKAKEAKEFCKNNSYNSEFCLLADMSIHSGKKRIFLWDFSKDTIIYSGLCAHGCCDYPWASDYSKTTPTFSNTPGSHCTSLGKFKIGKRGWSSFGINVNYLLYGLDSANCKALERQIVLHSWEMVSEEEVYPSGAPEGWGCPAVSDNFMRKIDEKLKVVKEPVLLWMY